MTFLIIILCLLPDTSGFGNNPQQEKERKRDECDFSEYKPIRISDYKTPIKKRVEPQYSKSEVDAKIGGKVAVKVLVDLKGNVIRACAATGHPLLKRPAIEAALRWRFIRNCKECFGRNATYMEEWIVFNFEASNQSSGPPQPRSFPILTSAATEVSSASVPEMYTRTRCS